MDLEDLQKDSTQPVMAKYAETFLASYKFPVMMMVATPSDGKVIHAINANEFLDIKTDLFESGFGDPSHVNYAKFLKDGISLAKQALPEV